MKKSPSDVPAKCTSSRTSALAMIAFALSLVSFFLCAGMAAVVLGVMALRRIRESGPMVKGRRLAKAAIVISISMPAWAFMLASLNMAHAITPEQACGMSLSSIGASMSLYADAHDGQLPTPSRWCDLIVLPEVGLYAFRCLGTERMPVSIPYPLERYLYKRRQWAKRQQGPCDYAMNEHATFSSLSPDLVLCFESKPGWNLCGGADLLTTEHHGGRGCNILFVGGHVKFVKTEQLGSLKWKPTD